MRRSHEFYVIEYQIWHLSKTYYAGHVLYRTCNAYDAITQLRNYEVIEISGIKYFS